MTDTLFLIEPGFPDPAYRAAEALPDNQTYYCPYCVAIEGVLAMFPERLAALKVVRLPFARPRQPLVDLLGDQNQGLPKLVLGEDAPDDLASARAGDVRFVDDHDAIMRALSKRYAIPYPHF
jgi:hypothetical protein